MVKLPFEDAAIRNENPPDGLDTADMCAFLSLRNLYYMMRTGAISKEDAKPIRQKIENEYRKNKESLNLIDRCAMIWNNINSAIYKYRSERTLENADALCEAIDGGVKDKQTE